MDCVDWLADTLKNRDVEVKELKAKIASDTTMFKRR